MPFVYSAGYHWIATQTADIERDLSVVPKHLCLLPTKWSYMEGKFNLYSTECKGTQLRNSCDTSNNKEIVVGN